MSTFEPADRNSWYFGPMSRQDATNLLMAEKDAGVFLVRDSTTSMGDYVLCVIEDNKVSNYIINKILQGGQTRYRIGDEFFSDLPALLSFYQIHYLDTTPLIRPAPKRVERVVAKYDFDGSDADDLPFRKGEILTVISKDEEQWWTAMNSLGQTGSIPVPYVQNHDGTDGSVREPASRISNSPTSPSAGPQQQDKIKWSAKIQRKLPAYARVKQARVPNAYDKTALRFEVGDTVKVTKMHINGQWEGELHGKVGHFPFIYVEFIDSENNDDGIDSSKSSKKSLNKVKGWRKKKRDVF
jgi:proto-oncogene C-crk